MQLLSFNTDIGRVGVCLTITKLDLVRGIGAQFDRFIKMYKVCYVISYKFLFPCVPVTAEKCTRHRVIDHYRTYLSNSLVIEIVNTCMIKKSQ